MRNHGESGGLEVERGKVERERLLSRRLEKRADSLVKQSLRVSDHEVLAQEYDEIVFQSRKVRGNQRTHRNRLRELQKNTDFDTEY